METIEEIAKELSLMNLQNLSGREDIHEIFEEGIKVGIEFSQEWISVEDELPELEKAISDFSDKVLTKNEYNNIIMVERYDYYNNYFTGLRYGQEVTHWRPIERG